MLLEGVLPQGKRAGLLLQREILTPGIGSASTGWRKDHKLCSYYRAARLSKQQGSTSPRPESCLRGACCIWSLLFPPLLRRRTVPRWLLGLLCVFSPCKSISAELEAWILTEWLTISVQLQWLKFQPLMQHALTLAMIFGVGVIPAFDIILHGSPNSCSTESCRPGLVPFHHTHTVCRFYFLFIYLLE